MPVKKPTILPDDPEKAGEVFKDLVDEPLILFVVLGNSPGSGEIVEMGSGQAGSDSDPIQVVWARTPAHIAGVVAKLRGLVPNLLVPDRAFTVSVKDEITCVIRHTEPPTDEVRVAECIDSGWDS